MMIIGDKEIFAVEYEITDLKHTMGYAKIWFGGLSLGTSEDLKYLKSYLLYGLEDIGNACNLELKFSSRKELYKILTKLKNNSESPDRLKYTVRNFGTFCDSFSIFSFESNGDIHILWKLRSNNTPFFDLNNQSLRINFSKINKSAYLEILNKLKSNFYHS